MVIGWISIVSAGYGVLSSGWEYWGLIQGGGIEAPVIPDDMSGSGRVVRLVALLDEYAGVLRFLGLALSVLTLIAGIQLLRLRSWARTVLEILYWLDLVLLVGFAGGVAIMQVMRSYPKEIDLQGVALILLVGSLMALPVMTIISYLRSDTIRQVVTRR